MAFPTTVNVSFGTAKGGDLNKAIVTEIKQSNRILDEEHATHSVRDFSRATGGTGNGTIEDMVAGGNGSPINGIPVLGGPIVEVDGAPIRAAKYIGQDKFRFDLWRGFSRSEWEFVRKFGQYYINAKKV